MSDTETTTAATLGRTDFFRGLPPPALVSLARLCRPRTLAKRAVLFMEGTKGAELYMLVEGRILLHKSAADGSDIVIRTVRPGEVFAEVILFEQERYPVTATALTPGRVLGFHRVDVQQLLEDRKFRDAFIANLMRKQRYLAERVRYLTTFDVEQRFFFFLREQFGEVCVIPMAISKRDIAAAMGTTPETFSRLLQRLQKKKILQWKDKKIVLPQDFWSKFQEP
jgi:CRP/FNR family transcriptional regulator, dissimilatory nitrate respiration regulator